MLMLDTWMIVGLEREACAVLADEYARLPLGDVPVSGLEAASQAGSEIASAIRARTT